MSSLAHHALLVLAACAIGAGAVRVAARATTDGLERAVAAAVVAGALIVAWPLVLAPFGLSGSSVALGLGALATWLTARRWLPAPSPRPAAQAVAGWQRASPQARAVIGALVMLTAGWIVWQLKHPYVSVDGFVYHLSLSGAWVQNGHAASIVDLVQGLPVANYPITNEVALTWWLGLSRSWVAGSVWTPLLLVVLVSGAWLALRELRVPPRVAALGIAAFLTLPLIAAQTGAPTTDIAASAWLVACAGLCASARRNPALLPFGLLAAGLSFGTKTTASILLAAALVAALWPARRQLRELSRPLLIAAGAAVLVGGLWTLRNLVDHGSPLWPFAATSFGDPVPASLAPYRDSFLSHPAAMLRGRVDDYAKLLAGGTVLLAGPLLAAVIARTRTVLVLAGLSALAVLVWSAAPYTGIDQTAFATGATRYLLPALACCILTVVVGARDAGRVGRAVLTALLAVAVLWSAARTWQLGYPVVPSASTVVGLAVLGALIATAVGRLGGVRVPARVVGPALAVGAGALSVLVLAAGARGYVERHAQIGLGDGPALTAALASPAFGDDGVAVGMAPTTIALLRGDHLQHDLDFVDEHTPCAQVRRRATDGLLVLQRLPVTPAYTRLAACVTGLTPRYQDGAVQLYGR